MCFIHAVSCADLYVVPGISTLRLWPWPRWGRNQWREPEGGGPASNVEASSFNSRASSVDLYVVLRISTPIYGRKPTTRTLRRVSDCSGIQCRPFRGPQDKYSLAVPWRLRREETNDTNIAQRLATRQYSDTILTLQVPSSTLSSDLALGLNSNGSIIVTG